MTEVFLSCVALGPLWEETETVILSGAAELKNIGRRGWRAPWSSFSWIRGGLEGVVGMS